MRNSIARVLPAWDRGHPLTSFVLGAYAFGLEETGELGAPEDDGRDALTRNPSDAWAMHALAHVFDHVPPRRTESRFSRAPRPDWLPRISWSATTAGISPSI